jgi:hypothetical protein
MNLPARLKPVFVRVANAPSMLSFCVFLLLAVVATFPGVVKISSALIGAPEGDSYEMMWLIWWLERALLDDGTSATNIPILFHPEGLSFPLLRTQIGAHLLSLPAAILTSPAAAFNLIMIASLALSGLTAYWLGVALTGSRPAGALCGLVWAFFPNKMGHALGGHLYQVAVFWLPLYGLAMWRMLARPSVRRGLVTGLSAVLVASVHSVHVVYFLLPLTLALLAADWMQRQPAYWNRQRLAGFGSAAVLVVAVLMPMYWPVFRQAARGELGFMAVEGAVGFSIDLASFFVPAPENPLLRMLPAAQEFSRRINATFNESIAYLGVLPVFLAGLAVWRGGRAVRRWAVLGGITALLSLGPLLKFGGRVVELKVDNISNAILLPYALLLNLPFMEWSRAPARLHATTHFALAVLVAYGAAALLARVRPRVYRFAVATVLGALIFLEYLVVWPFPIASTDVGAASQVVRANPGVVLPLPAMARATARESLLAQTVHGQPIIGGRLLRDMPERTHAQRFLHQALLHEDVFGADILPTTHRQERLQLLRDFHVGWVAYHSVGEEADGRARAALRALLGPAASSSDNLALYAVPPGHNGRDDLVYALGENWHAPEDWGGVPARWFHGNGELFVYSPNEHEAQLRLTLISELEPHSIAVKVNGEQVAEFLNGDWLPFVTEPFSVQRGLNVIEMVDLHGSRMYVGDLRCAGGTPLSGAFTVKMQCESGRSLARLVSAGVQAIQLLPATASASPEAIFGDRVSLLHSHWQRSMIPGDALRLTLYWRAERQIDSEWTAFVHVLSPDGSLVAGLDQQPMKGRAPTTTWSPGQVVAYTVAIPLPAAASGEHRIGIGWYQWPGLERLPARSESLPVVDEVVNLGAVFVQGGDETSSSR